MFSRRLARAWCPGWGAGRRGRELGDELVRPLVLVGADLGAAGIVALLADVEPDTVWWPQAAVPAGLPGYRARYDGGWEDELNIRTHCPTHRGVLADGTSVQHGRFAVAVPGELLDGEADPLADRDGHHDVLNDLQHRSVAAEIAAFLEALRDGLAPAVTVETSAW